MYVYMYIYIYIYIYIGMCYKGNNFSKLYVVYLLNCENSVLKQTLYKLYFFSAIYTYIFEI